MLRERTDVVLPDGAGLTVRPYRGVEDVPAVVSVINRSNDADGSESHETVEDYTAFLVDASGIDPHADVRIVEDAGEAVAYARVRARDLASGERLYYVFANVVGEWRGRGIGTALQTWMEQRVAQRAELEAAGRSVFIQTWCDGVSVAKARLIERFGFHVVRYSYEMARPVDTPIADFALPDGLEIRPITPDLMRAVWDADSEAFRDHWGYTIPTESDYRQWLKDSHTQPHLFKVAFDAATGEVAGMVQNFIDAEENARLGRKRGYTEGICTRRPYRRRGVARALICESLRMFRDMGFTEAALGVDTQNVSGALRVYEDCGFRVVKHDRMYRKELAR